MLDSLRISFFLLLFLLVSCADVEIEDYADSEPRLDFERIDAHRCAGTVSDVEGQVAVAKVNI